MEKVKQVKTTRKAGEVEDVRGIRDKGGAGEEEDIEPKTEAVVDWIKERK